MLFLAFKEVANRAFRLPIFGSLIMLKTLLKQVIIELLQGVDFGSGTKKFRRA